MTIRAERRGDQIVVTCSPRDRTLMQTVPGFRFESGNDWVGPLGWGSALALRSTFGAELELGDELREWGVQQKQLLSALDAARAGWYIVETDDRLMEQQKAGVEFLSDGKHVVLADEMRVGKTPQTILAIKEAGATPALIVTPNSVVYQWEDEIHRWWPGQRVSVVQGSAAQRKKALETEADFYIIGWANVWRHTRLAGYGSVPLKDEEKQPGLLNALGLRTVVADEAHRALSPKAKQTRAMWHLMHNAEYRFALTGTPVRNEAPEDVWAIGHLVAPYDYPVRSKYIERYAYAGQGGWGFEVFGWKPDKKDEALAVLDTHLLRRTYREVFPDSPEWLPPDVRRIALSVKQAKAYKEMKKHMIALLDDGALITGDPLVQVARLHQIAAAMPVLDESGMVVELDMPSSKIDALLEIVEDQQGESLVVFASSRKLIELASRVLEKKKVSHGVISGLVSAEDRKIVVDEFQAGTRQVILLTMGAGAEGLTLNRANKVLFLQRSYSLVENLQAEARIGGKSQERPMQVIDLIAEGTLDQAVLEAIAQKDSNLQEVLRDPDWIRRELLA